jgi:cytochrome c oxidase subunit 2
MLFKNLLVIFPILGLLCINSAETFCDCPEDQQLSMQDPASPMMEGMISFHHFLMFFIVFIGFFVCYMLGYAIYQYHHKRSPKSAHFSHNSTLEIVWTILPAIILLIIAVPSFSLLYSLDELIDPQLTVKIIGHQWYWSYEVSDFLNRPEIGNLEFDSYMMPTDTLVKTAFVGCRLLVSRPELVLPAETHIRLLVSSADVLHSWAVPSFGVKVDACPGRLSQASLFINRVLKNKTNIFFGQCSEICGVNHGFMPITVRAVSPEKYKALLLAKKIK